MKIICLGDSFTEGYLVYDKSYTRFLEKAGFAVRNLGVNGSVTEEMLNRYKRFMKEEKDDDDKVGERVSAAINREAIPGFLKAATADSSD